MKALRKLVGRLMIVGVEGAELSPLEAAWLKIVGPSGVILFRRNIEGADQTYKLLAGISALLDAPMFRCIDLEGGLVDRLRDLIAPMPSVAAVAGSRKASDYRTHGVLIGREAGVLGFNVVFAPVLDLALPASRAVMRTRTAFASAEEVVEYADAFLSGLENEGVFGCGKHFPGLGGSTLDSHHATPMIERTWAELWNNDLVPHRKLRSHLPMVMVSHASYHAAIGDATPASISRKWITDILVKKIGYSGLIISDDMEMGGILSQVSIGEAVVQAVVAGTHLVEICRDPALVLRAYEALLGEAERSASFRRIVTEAAQKISRARRKLAPMPAKPPTPRKIQRLREEVQVFRALHPEPAEQAAI